jgi:hypothetical protein
MEYNEIHSPIYQSMHQSTSGVLLLLLAPAGVRFSINRYRFRRKNYRRACWSAIDLDDATWQARQWQQ